MRDKLAPKHVEAEPCVGVLLLENSHLDVPGSMRHDDTFGRARRVTVVGGHGHVVAGPRFAEAEPAYVAAAREVRADGADLVTANCGFAIAYQDAVRDAAAPAALSSLLLLPLLRRVFGDPVGVLTYHARQLDAARRRAAGWPADAVVPVADVRTLPSWQALSADEAPDLDVAGMGRELVALARDVVARHRPRALLLECTGMFPFTNDVRAATGLPTFDLVGLVRYLTANFARAGGPTSSHDPQGARHARP